MAEIWLRGSWQRHTILDISNHCDQFKISSNSNHHELKFTICLLFVSVQIGTRADGLFVKMKRAAKEKKENKTVMVSKKEARRTTIADVFNQFDSNKDGKLSSDQLFSMLRVFLRQSIGIDRRAFKAIYTEMAGVDGSGVNLRQFHDYIMHGRHDFRSQTQKVAARSKAKLKKGTMAAGALPGLRGGTT